MAIEAFKPMEYVLVRTYSAGVFCGYFKERDGKEVLMTKARRIWYWDGAATLSQLAQEGTKDPKSCKFPCEVDKVLLTEAVEIISVTNKAKKSIQNVPVWSAKKKQEPKAGKKQKPKAGKKQTIKSVKKQTRKAA